MVEFVGVSVPEKSLFAVSEVIWNPHFRRLVSELTCVTAIWYVCPGVYVAGAEIEKEVPNIEASPGGGSSGK